MTRDVSLGHVLDQLESWGSARSWIGPDPYEGLNTPAASVLRRSRRGMQGIVQLNRRSPVALPWPLRASSMANSKVAGLVLSAYAQPAGSSLPGAAGWVARLQKRLEQLRLTESNAWGYHFDVQLRHIFYSATTPNAVATCFAVRGLLDAADAGAPDAAAAALRARPYLMSLLRDSPHGPFFAYVGAGSELIHNANLKVCGALSRLQAHDRDSEVDTLVEAAAKTTVKLRREDGNWPYGERADLQWRDNFHTAYLLEGLARVHALTGNYADVLESAVGSWLATFFDEDGTARFHPGRPYPVDTHSAASALDALCIVADARPHLAPMLVERARLIAARAVELLWLPERERFAMQINARSTNRREFMRWTNAPMFAGLARLLSA